MGITQSILEQHERMLFCKQFPHFADYVIRDSSYQKIDSEIRIWIILCVPEVFEMSTEYNRKAVAKILDRLKGPMDMHHANTANCIFMRFVDISPIWIFWDICNPAVFDHFYGVSSLLTSNLQLPMAVP